MLKDEVAIVGCGTSAAAAAIVTASAGLKTLLVGSEWGPKPILHTLSPRARAALGPIQAAGELDDAAFTPCACRRSAWGSSAVAEIDAIYDPWGPARFVMQPAFDRSMVRLATESGAHRVPHSLVHAEASAGGWQLYLSSGSAIHAKFVIDGSGRTASFARKAGAVRVQVDRLMAAAVRSKPRGESFGFTFVESVADGWWYTGFTTNAQSSAVFFSDSDLPTARSAITAEGWTRLLRQTAHTRFLVGGTAVQPDVLRATSEYLSPCAGVNWAAVGDAQATYDPLSSEGLVQALESAQHAARAVIAYFGGDEQAARYYRIARELAFLRYLSERSRVYRMESRWPQAAFWKRRIAVENKVNRMEEI